MINLFGGGVNQQHKKEEKEKEFMWRGSLMS
jgi:hypothetical protein